MRSLVLCFGVIFMASCSLGKDGEMRDYKGEILVATDEEIVTAQKAVINANSPEDLPDKAEGGVLFEGKVLSVKRTIKGLLIVQFDIENIIFGELVNNEKVSIHTSSSEKTGINFKEGEVYRVFAIFLEGEYRTWNWLGTVKLN